MTPHEQQQAVLAALITVHFGGLIATITWAWVRDARREHHA
jgi:predicted acyl esterase